MQFHQSAKDWKYLFLLLFFWRRFWPWRDQNPMVIPLSNLEYDVDEKENASEKCVHEMSKVSLLIFDLSKMSKDAKMFKFQLSKRWQSCHFPNIKRCQGVNLLQSPTNLFYLKALVSFGGNPNLVHEKSSLLLESSLLLILFIYVQKNDLPFRTTKKNTLVLFSFWNNSLLKQNHTFWDECVRDVIHFRCVLFSWTVDTDGHCS